MSEMESRVRSSERSCAIAVLSKLFGGIVQAVAVFSDCVVFGSGCGLRLGRQAAWRPGYIWVGVVKVIGGTVQAVAVFSDCEVLGSGCGLRLGRQAAWRPGYIWVGVVKVIGGTVHAVAVFSDCEVLGLWLRALARSSSCLAAGETIGMVSSK